MRPFQRIVCPVLCLAAVACHFDFVEPSPGADVTLLVVLDATEWSQGRLGVLGDLLSGVDGSGPDREILDPRLVLAGIDVAPDTVHDGGSLRLHWDAMLAFDEPLPTTVILRSPVADGVPAFKPLPLVMRSAVGGPPARGEWQLGKDLVLQLFPPLEEGRQPSEVHWRLRLTGWSADGEDRRLVDLSAEVVVPGTILIPADWLQGVDADSLRASLDYRRTFRDVAPDSNYVRSVQVTQRLEWFYLVRP